MYINKNEVELRKMTKSDLKELLKLKEESWITTHNVSILNIENQLDWFESINRKNDAFILIGQVLYRNETVNIGVFIISNIDYINRRCWISYSIYKEYRGLGYGNKLVQAGIDFIFEILNLNRIDTSILEINGKSLKIILSCGFKKEGYKDMVVYRCSKWYAEILFGITRDVWEGTARFTKSEGVCNINV